MRVKPGTVALLVVMVTVVVVTYIGYSHQCLTGNDVIQTSDRQRRLFSAANSSREDISFGETTDVEKEEYKSSGTERKSVVLLAYHRTGSTLTGSLLHAYPNSFYVFEPFKYINDNMNTVMTYLNGSTVLVTRETKDRVFDELSDAWLNCDLNRIHVETLLEYHHVVTGDSLRDLVQCTRKKLQGVKDETVVKYFIEHSSPRILNMIRACAKPVAAKCQSASLKVIKYIRLRMLHVQNMLYTYPDLKVVHLIRDPRGTVLSRKRVYDRTYSFLANEYCDHLTIDTLIKKCLDKTFPGRIHSLRYETLAIQPVATTGELYQFLHLPFKTQVKDTVLSLMSSKHQLEECRYCVNKRNSSLHAFQWRETITKDELGIIDEFCMDAYRMNGYIHLPNLSDVKNVSKPSMIDIY